METEKTRKLLVPVHFSRGDDGDLAVATDSMEAVEQALELARCQPTELTFTHVFAGREDPGSSSDDGDLPEIHSIMDQLVARAADQSTASGIEFLFGRPWDEIANFAAAEDFDLVVVGTRLKPGEDGCLLGSTATRVVHASSAATWIAKRRQPKHSGVLVAVDLSPASHIVLRRGVELSHSLHSELHVVHAYGAPPSSAAESTCEELQLRRVQLEAQMAEVVGDGPLPPFVSHVQFGDADTVIWDVARREHTDVVVVGLGDRTAYQQLIHSDTAAEVLAELPCSLLTVRVD